MFLLLCDVAFKPSLTQPAAIVQMAVEETWWWYERMKQAAGKVVF
jgi:hypothetical protein